MALGTFCNHKNLFLLFSSFFFVLINFEKILKSKEQDNDGFQKYHFKNKDFEIIHFYNDICNFLPKWRWEFFVIEKKNLFPSFFSVFLFNHGYLRKRTFSSLFEANKNMIIKILKLFILIMIFATVFYQNGVGNLL
jgi:hypothetical protein